MLNNDIRVIILMILSHACFTLNVCINTDHNITLTLVATMLSILASL